MSENRITIAVSGGMVTHAYSTLHPSKLDVELLDFDAAKNLSDDAVELLHKRFREVEKSCRKLSMEISIGLPEEECAAASGVR